MNTHDTLLSPESKEQRRYESSDVNPYSIAVFGTTLIVLLLVVLPCLSWIYSTFEIAHKQADQRSASTAGQQTPPEPRLQHEPANDLAEFRKAEQNKLSDYCWVEKERGLVRIPIERAMVLLSERGFPRPEQRLPKPNREKGEP